GSFFVSVFRNDGSGNFPSRTDYSIPGPPNNIIAADIDGDGFIDLLTTDLATDDVTIFINNGSGAFPTRTNYNGGPEMQSLVAADINNDGALDVLATNAAFTDHLSTLMNIGGG